MATMLGLPAMRPTLVLVAVVVLLVRAVERGIEKGVVAAVHLP